MNSDFSVRYEFAHAIRADGEWLTEFDDVVIIGSAKPYVDDWYVEKIYVYVMRIDGSRKRVRLNS